MPLGWHAWQGQPPQAPSADRPTEHAKRLQVVLVLWCGSHQLFLQLKHDLIKVRPLLGVLVKTLLQQTLQDNILKYKNAERLLTVQIWISE